MSELATARLGENKEGIRRWRGGDKVRHLDVAIEVPASGAPVRSNPWQKSRWRMIPAGFMHGRPNLRREACGGDPSAHAPGLVAASCSPSKTKLYSPARLPTLQCELLLSHSNFQPARTVCRVYSAAPRPQWGPGGKTTGAPHSRTRRIPTENVLTSEVCDVPAGFVP